MSALDPRLVFLLCAHARLILVEAGAITLEDAVGGLVPQFDLIVGPTPCAFVQDMIDRWERTHPPRRNRQRWRR
jgi:hypothetical protein